MSEINLSLLLASFTWSIILKAGFSSSIHSLPCGKGHAAKFHMSHVMRKSAFLHMGKTKAQIGDRAADQCLCFHFIDSSNPLLPESEFLSL